MTDATELERLAKTAMPGPWYVDPDTANSRVFSDSIVARGDKTIAFTSNANAAYIAAADPTTILAICERLRNVEAERDRLRGALKRLSTFETMTTEGWGFLHPELTARVEYARAALADKEGYGRRRKDDEIAGQIVR